MENEKVNATNYEFWVSTKELFWTPNSPDKPSKELFDKDYEPTFQKLDKCYVTFVSRFTMRTVLPKFINNQQPTILKIVDKETGEKRYFLLNKTIKEASGMFEYEGTLDAWLTYGHPFIEWAKTSSIPIKVNRFLNNRLMRQYLYEHHYEKTDELFNFDKESYTLAVSANPVIGGGNNNNIPYYYSQTGEDIMENNLKDHPNVTNIYVSSNNTDVCNWRVFVCQVDRGNLGVGEFRYFIAPEKDVTIEFWNGFSSANRTKVTYTINSYSHLENWLSYTAVGTKLRGVYNIPFFKSIPKNWRDGLVIFGYVPTSTGGGNGNCLVIRSPITNNLNTVANNQYYKNNSFYPSGYAFAYPTGVTPIHCSWYCDFSSRRTVDVVIPQSTRFDSPRWIFTIPFVSNFRSYGYVDSSSFTYTPTPLHPYLLSRISYNGIHLTPESRLRGEWPSGSSWIPPAKTYWNKRPDGLWLNALINYDGLKVTLSNRGMFSQAVLYQTNGSMTVPISTYNEYLQSSRSQMNAQLQIAKENSDLQRTKAISESVTSTANNVAKGVGNFLSGNWVGLASSVAKTASSISNGVTGVMEAENIYKHKELQIEAAKADKVRVAKPTIIASNYALDDFEQKYREYLQKNMKWNATGLTPMNIVNANSAVEYDRFYFAYDYRPSWKQYEDGLLVKAPFDQISSRFYMDMLWRVGVKGDFYSACSWVFGNDDNTPNGYEYYRITEDAGTNKYTYTFRNHFTFLNLDVEENVYRQFKSKVTLEELASIRTIFESGVRIWYSTPTFFDRNTDESVGTMRYVLIPFNPALEDFGAYSSNSTSIKPFEPYVDKYYGEFSPRLLKGGDLCSSVENDSMKSTKNTKKRNSK